MLDTEVRKECLPSNREASRKTINGYETTSRVYRCDDCASCPAKSECIQKDGRARHLWINKERIRLQERAKELLVSDEGVDLRRRRATDVETVFGNTKHNHRFRRFSMRGIEKVSLEWGWMMLGHNMRKLHTQMAR